LRRSQAGDEAAFRELFDRYHRRAFSVAVGVVKNQSDAFDIVQDAFIKVHRHIKQLPGVFELLHVALSNRHEPRHRPHPAQQEGALPGL
jgi:DNA-directed RNA polymerase specialized sigma24 family protein